MIRLDDKIRLNPTEKRAFDSLSMGAPAPQTVQEHDAQLEAAAQMWEDGGSAEEQLAALLARDMKLQGTPEAGDEDKSTD